MNALKFAVLSTISLAISGCCAPPSGGKSSPGGTPGATPAAPKADEPATTVDLKTLLKDYKDNEVRADGLYKDKRVQLTGKVGDIKKDMLNKIYVTLGTGAQFEMPVVQCFFDDEHTAKASALSKGQSLTVKGRVSGLMMNVLVKDCEL